MDDKIKNAKKIIVERSENRVKLIVYRDLCDGGIQGIMMDFYMDAHGHVANEFYKIDDEGNLI